MATGLGLRQPTLFATTDETIDNDLSTAVRTPLDDESWFELAPAFLRGSDHLFERLVASAPWQQPEVTMWDRRLLQPRLSAYYPFDVDEPDDPLIEGMGVVLSARYNIDFDRIGMALYRDGHDSVAMHSDRHARHTPNPVIAIVSLGSPRRFNLRAKHGSGTHHLRLDPGDLLVMGGACQHRWEHGVPKMAYAGPRISVAFRHGTHD
jgi:alkylated DNA repair dioxygenase AlkB